MWCGRRRTWRSDAYEFLVDAGVWAVLGLVVVAPVARGYDMNGFMPAAGEGAVALSFSSESYDHFWPARRRWRRRRSSARWTRRRSRCGAATGSPTGRARRQPAVRRCRGRRRRRLRGLRHRRPHGARQGAPGGLRGRPYPDRRPRRAQPTSAGTRATPRCQPRRRLDRRPAAPRLPVPARRLLLLAAGGLRPAGQRRAGRLPALHRGRLHLRAGHRRTPSTPSTSPTAAPTSAIPASPSRATRRSTSASAARSTLRLRARLRRFGQRLHDARRAQHRRHDRLLGGRRR